MDFYQNVTAVKCLFFYFFSKIDGDSICSQATIDDSHNVAVKRDVHLWNG